MPNVVRNVLAILAGIVIGSVVNMAIVKFGGFLIPLPPGVDVSNPESLAKAMPLFEPRHFVAPFLAHALGTLAGALAAYLIAATRRAQMAYLIGALFLVGGVAASFMIPAPGWFIALDLLAGYIPMAWLAIQIGARIKPGNAAALRSET